MSEKRRAAKTFGTHFRLACDAQVKLFHLPGTRIRTRLEANIRYDLHKGAIFLLQ